MMNDGVAQLSEQLGCPVCLPGSPGYQASLGRVFFPEASRRHPLCVVQPRCTEDVAATMQVAAASGMPVTVRGGGLSSTCVSDDAVMLDLSVYMTGVSRVGDHVWIEGGATVGSALQVLEPVGRVIPVGVVGMAGFGLLTRGGIGYLTRSLGLTVDHLVEVELVLPGGETVRLSEVSRGRDADLWWAVRGCAPSFGVVTGARLRTHEQGPVFVDRLVVGLDALAAYFRIAPNLPRHTSMGAVLGYVPGSSHAPVLFVYTACASGNAADIAAARTATSAVAAASSHPPVYRREVIGRYLRGMPEFAVPGLVGEEPDSMKLAGSAEHRGWFDSKSVFTGPSLGADVADTVAELIRLAPTRLCRIDFQQTGGALADVTDSASAFWGRGGEWNVSLNAVWNNGLLTGECRRWALEVVQAVAADTIGVYSVGVRQGLPETAHEIELTFGANLPRLTALREQVDPTGVLTGCPL